MLQCLLSSRSLVLVFCQQVGDEILCLIRNISPDCVLERELAKLDLFHDLLVGGSVEWRDTGEHDVGDDTARPNIAL